MEPLVGLAHTRAGMDEIRAALADGDLAAAVPACPGWTLDDLVRHVGGIHRWVWGAVVEGHPDTELPAGPAGRAPLIDWYDEGAGRLLDVLVTADPDAPCWTFGPKPSSVRFWFRRQAHEHAVHAVDAAASQARTLPLDPELALDGVDEVVRMFFPRQVRLGRMPPLTRSLALRPVGAGAGPDGEDGVRVLVGSGLAAEVAALGPGSADATVSGPAEALYLLAWRRIGLDDDRLTLIGDPAAARAVLAAAIIP